MPNKPVLFKDLNKRLSDLLNKEFPLENKVEWKGETANGMIVETNLVQRNGAVIGTFMPKYKYKEYGAEFLAEINTKKEFKTEVSIADNFLKGLKMIVTGNSKGDEMWVTGATEYRGSDKFTATGSVDYGKESGSTAKGSFTFGSNGWVLGASADYFFGSESSSLKEFNSQISYENDEYQATGFGRMKAGQEEKNEVGFSYYHAVNKDLTVGTEVSLDHANTEAKPRIVFGTQYKPLDGVVFKSKYDSQGQLGLSYGQELNRNTRFVLSGTFDTLNLNAKNSAKLGFTLNLSS